jgi:hypothetical protein
MAAMAMGRPGGLGRALAPNLVGLDRTSRSSHDAHARDIKGRNMLRRMMFRGSTSLLRKLFIGATVPAVVFKHC